MKRDNRNIFYVIIEETMDKARDNEKEETIKRSPVAETFSGKYGDLVKMVVSTDMGYQK